MSIIMDNVKEIQYNNKSLKKIEYNGNVIWKKLSKRFSQLDYIDIAAGSYCDLNAGVVTTSGTETAYTGKHIYYAIDAIFNVDNTPLSSGQSQLFGALVNSSGQYQRYHMYYTSAGNTVAYSGNNTQTVISGVDLTQRHLFELNGTGNKVYIDSVDKGTFLPPDFMFYNYALNGRWFYPNFQPGAFKGRYYSIDKRYVGNDGNVFSLYLNTFYPAIDHANNDAVVLVQTYKDSNGDMQFYKVHNITGTATAGTVVSDNPSWSPDL